MARQKFLTRADTYARAMTLAPGHICPGSLRSDYLFNVTFDVERQVEEELEPLKNTEGVPSGVRLVLPTQHFLKQTIGTRLGLCKESKTKCYAFQLLTP